MGNNHMSTGQTTRRPTRGVRNNNPGNIRHAAGTRWQGSSPSQPDREFVSFISPEMGVRALVRVLLTYEKRHGLRTVRGIIRRWAPPVGDRNGSAPGGQYRQNTASYVDAVCRAMTRALGRTVSADEVLDMDSVEVMRPLVVAIIAHENAGYRYPDRVIDEGLRLAGIANARPRPAAASGEVGGALIAAGATGGGAAMELMGTFEQVRYQLEPLAYFSTWISVLLILITLAGVGLTIWSHVQRKKKGLA